MSVSTQAVAQGVGGAVAVAESRVRDFIAEYRPRWLYVLWSGGKDSTAALAASLNVARFAGVPVKAVYVIVPGQTHPDNTRAVLEVWRRLCPGCPVRYLSARTPSELRAKLAEAMNNGMDELYVIAMLGPRGRDFWMGVEKYGLPTPIPRPGARWCRHDFKQRAWNALPTNATVDGRPARVLVCGVRRGESSFRKRRWPEDTPVTIYEPRRSGGVPDVALSPIYDMSSDDVWAMLDYYGVGDILRQLYEKWGSSPSCALCPLRSTRKLEPVVRNLPTPYLERARSAIAKSLGRWKPGTVVHRKSIEMLRLIDEELERRRRVTPQEA